MDRDGEPLSLHESNWLRRWICGPNAGRPKIKSVVQSMLDRGLIQIVDAGRGIPTARFTTAGAEPWHAMTANRK